MVPRKSWEACHDRAWSCSSCQDLAKTMWEDLGNAAMISFTGTPCYISGLTKISRNSADLFLISRKHHVHATAEYDRHVRSRLSTQKGLPMRSIKEIINRWFSSSEFLSSIAQSIPLKKLDENSFQEKVIFMRKVISLQSLKKLLLAVRNAVFNKIIQYGFRCLILLKMLKGAMEIAIWFL